MSPALHSTLLGTGAVAILVVSGLILARYPASTSGRVHAVYGLTAAWWLMSMSMVASAESLGRAQLWARLAQLGVCMLPGVIYHVNVATAGIANERRRHIRVYYALSLAVTAVVVMWPPVLTTPYRYWWGFYPAYSAWGALPAALLLAVFAEALRAYREAMRRLPPGSPHHRRARALYLGNHVAYLAAVDFAPAFGVPIYPFGFVLVVAMFVATMVGAVRYRLIEITPEIAADHILDTIPDGLLVVDTQGTVRLANKAAAQLLESDAGAMVNRPLTQATVDPVMASALADGPPHAREVRVEGPRGARHVVVMGADLSDPWNEPLGHLWLLRDLTEQRRAEAEKARLEERLGQTQKMQSLGVMAGGIAHDFNNILMAILGSAEAASRKVATGAPIDEELRTIATASEQAAELTDQLLTYAGRGTSTDVLVDIDGLVREMADLLRSAVSKKAALVLDLSGELPQVLGDRSQMRQVILNLVTNASEALGDDTGSVIVRTRILDPSDAIGDHAVPRVSLEVQDTGAGMTAATRARAFEPFFTTKFEGRGLGLATVLSIVQRHGGVIDAGDGPGSGTLITITLPAAAAAGPAPVEAARASPAWTTSGRALLVDDEAQVRAVVRQMLAALGFEVVEAADGAEAIQIVNGDSGEFVVGVLDMTMPRMGGAETLAALRPLRPSMPIVLVSGYSVDEDGGLAADPLTTFLHKPFRLPVLAARIRKVIAAADARRGA